MKRMSHAPRFEARSRFFVLIIALSLMGACGDTAGPGTSLDAETFDLPIPEPDVVELDAEETIQEETKASCDDSILKPFECPCNSNGDCESGYCITTANGKQCTFTCVEDCPVGWACEFISGLGSDSTFLCVPANVNLCRPCATNSDCKDAFLEQSERCLLYGELGNFCGVACAVGGADCPSGFVCEERTTVNGLLATQCVAETGLCPCSPLAIQQGAETTCSATTDAGTCEGKRVCGPDGLTECDAWVAEEVCDGIDNDCDGQVDENTCTAANATASACVDGVCKILDCEVGFEDLDDNFETGCECQKSEEVCDGNDNDCDGQVDEGSTLCHGGPGCEGLCVNGKCECPGGCDFCNFQCVKQSSYAIDVNNCGYCGHACDLPNTAIHKCDAGKCCPVVCLEGFKDCNGECEDGCEAAISPEVCDGADNDCDGLLDETPLADCPLPSTCISGICECDTSNPTLKKCDGQCTNIKEDVEHCGACGNDCADLNVPNVLTFTCIDGKCVIGQCTPPFYDANQDIFDGCECQKTSIDDACDGVDNNCDGQIDGWSQTCVSECGDGEQECVAGVWGPCTAAGSVECTDYNTCGTKTVCADTCPAAPAEQCNGLDDNCNNTIDEGFLCKAGDTLDKACGDQCGIQTFVCSNSCEWSELGDCAPQGECKPGTTGTDSCGQCGVKTRSCEVGCMWGPYGACENEKTCAPGMTKSQACGACGSQTQTCTAECEWPAWDACEGQGVCNVNDVDEQNCGVCGIQKRTCTANCTWGAFGACVEGGACDPGATQTQDCGNCGSQTRTCTNQCQWPAWGGCNGQGSCSPGQTDSQSCGNCGDKTRTCSGNCQWGGFGSCAGQGACSPGQTQDCGDCGDQKCGGNCQWGSCKNQGCSCPTWAGTWFGNEGWSKWHDSCNPGCGHGGSGCVMKDGDSTCCCNGENWCKPGGGYKAGQSAKYWPEGCSKPFKWITCSVKFQ